MELIKKCQIMSASPAPLKILQRFPMPLTMKAEVLKKAYMAIPTPTSSLASAAFQIQSPALFPFALSVPQAPLDAPRICQACCSLTLYCLFPLPRNALPPESHGWLTHPFRSLFKGHFLIETFSLFKNCSTLVPPVSLILFYFSPSCR